MKTCCRCKELKSVSDFNVNRANKDGLQSHCRECSKKSDKQWYADNTKRARKNARKSYLKNQYGISAFEYNEMLVKQNGCCAICGTSAKDFKRSLAVDHCHTTGKVRSLLCHNCNTTLGLIKENKETLATMISYLMEHTYG